MAQYTAIFTKPYEDGYENLPSQNTPITAETLNDKDDAIVNIETYLSGNDIPSDAEGLSYDNTDSGLTADNVQGAVDELADEKVDKTGVDVKTNTTGQFNTITGGLMQSCVVDLEPIQDLHGYSKPWTGGSGKNLFNATVDGYKAENTDGTWNGNVYTYNGLTFTLNTDNDGNIVSIKINGTNGSNYTRFFCPLISLPANTTYTLSGVPSGYGGTNLALYFSGASAAIGVNPSTNNGSPVTFTTVTAGSVKPAININPNITINNAICYPQLELGSSATTFEPYSNICPISGHTQVDVWNDPKYGKPITWNQLVQNGNFASTSNWVTSSGNTFTVSNNVATFKASAQYQSVNQTLAITPSGHKIFFTATVKSYTSATNVTRAIVRLFTSISPATYTDVSISLSTTETKYQKVLSIPSDVVRVSIFFQDNASSNWGNITIKNVNFVDLTRAFGKTVADYIYNLEQTTTGAGVAYFRNLFPKDYYDYNSGEFTCVSAVNGDTCIQTTINLGGTYYGGTLDAVSGVLTVTHGFDIIDGSKVTGVSSASTTDTLGGKRINTNISNAKYAGSGSAIPNITSDKLSVASATDIYATNVPNRVSVNDVGGITLRYNGASTLADAQTALNSSPVQVCYELATPFTIQLDPQTLETLVGQNDVFAPLDGQTLDSLTYREVLAWDDVERAVAVKLDLSSVAPIEYTDKASQSYNQKQLFIKDNKLCQALASISSGASFTENTNFKYTTLAEIIEPLIP